MPNEQPRAPRKTIGEFGRDIDELRGSARQLGVTLPALNRALSAFLDDSTVAIYLYDEEDDEFVLRGSTQRLPPTASRNVSRLQDPPRPRDRRTPRRRSRRGPRRQRRETAG